MSKAENNGNDLTQRFDHKLKAMIVNPVDTTPAANRKRKGLEGEAGPSKEAEAPLKKTRRTSKDADPETSLTEMDEDESVHSDDSNDKDPTVVPVVQTAGTSRPSFLSIIRTRDAKPHPIRNNIFILVSPHHYLSYFENVYRAIVNSVYPASAIPVGVCTEIQFTRVCRYLMKARIDAVYNQTAGRRIADRTPVPKDYEIAKSVADVINNIGVVHVDQGGLTVIPRPEDQQADEEQRPSAYGTLNNLTAVSSLVLRAKGLGLIKTDTISPRPEGTPYWIMSARTTTDAIANNAGVATAHAVFREFTPSDAIFCTMVQNGFNGSIGGHATLLWTMEPVTGIQELRSTYALQA